MACCLARQQRVIEAFFTSRRNYIKLTSVVGALARATFGILYEMKEWEEIWNGIWILWDINVLKVLVGVFVGSSMIGSELFLEEIVEIISSNIKNILSRKWRDRCDWFSWNCASFIFAYA